jgi:hypothetical protein
MNLGLPHFCPHSSASLDFPRISSAWLSEYPQLLNTPLSNCLLAVARVARKIASNPIRNWIRLFVEARGDERAR